MRSTLKGRIAALAAIFVVALSLAACGGGGGDGSDSIATVPVATPVALTPSWSNAPVATSSGTEAAKQFAAKAPLRANGAQAAPVDPYGGVEAFNAIEQLLDFGERNFPQYFPDHRATAVYEKFRYRYYPATGIYLGVAYAVTAADGLEESGIYVMGGPFGNSPTHVGTLRQYITPETPAVPRSYANWWNGTQVAIYPMGTKVVGANQLPQGCNSWSQQCWKDSVANGTVKFVSSEGKNLTGRNIVFAYFRNTTVMFGADGLWNYLPFYADTGEAASQDISGGDATSVDYVVGNQVGVVISAGGQCYERYFNGSTGWNNRSVACQ